MSVVSGDPFGEIKPDKKPATNAPEPREVNRLHARSDVDSSTTAQHHTLGIKHTQAAYGDHVHDGKSSRKVGQGLSLTVSGSRGGNAALASLLTMLGQIIEFTDNTTA
jgi:hypothetical protein